MVDLNAQHNRHELIIVTCEPFESPKLILALVLYNYHLRSIDYAIFTVIGVMLESTSYSVLEGSSIDVCVMLSGELEREVPLSLITKSGSAELHKDYADVTNILHLLPGDGRVCFSVESLEDDIVEGDEMLQVVLNGNDSVFMNGNVVNITIKDNDSKLYYCMWMYMSVLIVRNCRRCVWFEDVLVYSW